MIQIQVQKWGEEKKKNIVRDILADLNTKLQINLPFCTGYYKKKNPLLYGHTTTGFILLTPHTQEFSGGLFICQVFMLECRL